MIVYLGSVKAEKEHHEGDVVDYLAVLLPA